MEGGSAVKEGHLTAVAALRELPHRQRGVGRGERRLEQLLDFRHAHDVGEHAVAPPATWRRGRGQFRFVKGRCGVRAVEGDVERAVESGCGEGCGTWLWKAAVGKRVPSVEVLRAYRLPQLWPPRLRLGQRQQRAHAAKGDALLEGARLDVVLVGEEHLRGASEGGTRSVDGQAKVTQRGMDG